MAIDLPTFRNEFPEFNSAPDTLVQAMLNRAITYTPDTVWGGNGGSSSLTERGTLVRTAWLLANSPYARKMALLKDGSTVYALELRELKRIVTSGFRVT